MKKFHKSIMRNADRFTSSWAEKAPKRKAGVIGYMALLELLVLIPEMLLSLPLLILAYCSLANMQAQIIGDNTTLPNWFTPLLIFTAVITIALIFIIQILIIKTTRTAWKRTNRK